MDAGRSWERDASAARSSFEGAVSGDVQDNASRSPSMSCETSDVRKERISEAVTYNSASSSSRRNRDKEDPTAMETIIEEENSYDDSDDTAETMLDLASSDSEKTIATVRPGRLQNIKGSGEKSGTRSKNYDHRFGKGGSSN